MAEEIEFENPSGTVFRFAAPIKGTENPAETWLPGRMDSHASMSMWPRGVYSDPVIIAVPEPYDRSIWPCIF